MIRYAFILIIFILSACKSDKPKEKEPEVLNVIKDTIIEKSNSLENDSIESRRKELSRLYNRLEIIEYSDITINDSLGVENKLEDLIKFAGKPDSIVESKWGAINNWFGEEKAWLYYYKNSYFETNGKVANLDRIYFRDNKFKFQYIDITFDKNTTIEDFKEYFPVAYERAKIEKLQYTPGESFIIRILPNRTDGAAWLFEFVDGKLDNVLFFIDNT